MERREQRINLQSIQNQMCIENILCLKFYCFSCFLNNYYINAFLNADGFITYLVVVHMYEKLTFE